MTAISRAQFASFTPVATTPKAELGNQRFKITADIKHLENSINELSVQQRKTARTVNADQSILASLKNISIKHGEDASVRLKGDQFKFGQPTGFFAKVFNGSRYQLEREAAAQSFNVNKSEISVSSAISIVNDKIYAAHNKMESLDKEISSQKTELRGLQSKQMGIEEKIRSLAKSEADASKANAAGKEQRAIFAAIYQSNAGCAALNAEARYQFGNASSPGRLRSSDVLSEYQSVHGSNIFGKGNAELKSSISSNCSNLAALAKTSAKALYTPRKENIVTHRGQGMTDNGINKLIEQFNIDKNNNNKTVYSAGQFFSTSTMSKVASDFAERSNDDVKVMFKVTGNSSHSLVVRGGLQFENKEGEKLYSPLANFKVTNISKSADGIYHVALQEVPQTKNATPLPY